MKPISPAKLLLTCLSWGFLVIGDNTFSKVSMPKFADTDMIELHHLRSFPVTALISDAGTFKFQTSGIALRSTETSAIIVLEFKPVNISACFLPMIMKIYDENGSEVNSTLVWDKRSTVSYETEIDPKYWMQSTFLGIINGVVYRNYLNWVEEYLTKSPGKYFIPQSICSGSEEDSCFTLPSTGDTFFAASLSLFAELFVKMHAVIPPRASEIHLISYTEPRSFKLPDSLDSMGTPRYLHPSSGQVESGSSPENVPIDSSLNSVSPPSSILQSFSSSLSVSLFPLPLLPDLFSAFMPTGGSLRGVHPDENSMELKPNKNRNKRHPPTVYPTDSSSPTASPSTSPTSTPTFLLYHSSAPSLLSPSVSLSSAPSLLPPSVSLSSVPSLLSPSVSPSPSSVISDTSMSRALSSAPTSTSTTDSTSIPSADSHNATDWYDEKGKEEVQLNAVEFQDTAVTQYFMKQINCMQAYSLEYFADALKSCLKDSDGFIHINGNEYYHIRPRQPFALQKDYWQPIPSPLKLDKSGQDISDIVISLSILVVTIIGLSAALWKLKMFDWVFVKSHKVWKKRITANAPTEGGYCSVASELPMYRIWGAGVIMHSDIYNKLHTEDPDEGWSSGDSRDRDRGSDRDKDKSDLAGASAMAEGGEVECVNINNVRSSDISGDEEGGEGEEEKLLASCSSSVNKRNSNSSANISSGPLCCHDKYSPSIRSRGRSGSVNSKSERELVSVERRRGSGREKGDNSYQSARRHSTVQSENASTSAQMFGGNFKGKSESSNCESSGSGSSNGNGKRRKGIRSTGESYARYYECSSESGTNTDISPNRCRVRDKKIERERDAESSVTHRPRIPGHYNNESRTVDISHRSSRNRYIKSPSSKNNSRTSSPDSRHSSCKSSSKNRRASDSYNFNSIVNYHSTCATPAVPVSTSPSISTSTSLISLTILTCPSATATREVGGSNLLSDDFSTNRRTGHDDSCSDMSDTNDVNFRKEFDDSHHEWGKGKMVPNSESSYRRASVTGTGTGTGARLDIEMGTLNLSPSTGTNHMKSPLSTAAVNGSRVSLPQSPPLRQKISPPRNTYPSDSERDRDRDRASSQSDDSSYKVRDHTNESEISVPKQFDLILEEVCESAFS